MKIACFTFTRQGSLLAEKLAEDLGDPVELFTKEHYKAQLPRVFEEFQGIIFISSTGIAVRLSAAFLQDKTCDPAIVVVDDLGRYAISLLSGHLGGANRLAEKIAGVLACQPIVTTASDGRGIEAIDLFAQRHGFIMESMQDVKVLTGMMVDGKALKLLSEVQTSFNYPHCVDKMEDAEGCIYISSQTAFPCELPHCVLRPKNLAVGIGCRKGKSVNEILKALEQVFARHYLSLKSIRLMATIDVKKDEAGILAACEMLGAELRIFRADEIQQVQEQFAGSEFVESQVGVKAVSEPCAFLAGGDILVGKTAIDGITIAVAKLE
ncbi:cobalt-precorrin 5A hydrolase [candidate division KSB3 bacterium]|uniref:Cobalt-precorrin 5A hydrolase n=1 Tax=candidate division KSB3 bacterium TaxID=2044937 RepID=A0A2G6EA60_9BACT|nr:MAG: cobalt-precorrin 5A hydrolase [candidate division KSB3 bacterium]PIE30908.1 MAG: cobalt-precorrin 5A hydrolase [candidate division KSB3 bacterium]